MKKFLEDLDIPLAKKLTNLVIFVICTIVVIILRLFNIIELSWFWILLPILAPFAIFILVSIIILIYAIKMVITDSKGIGFEINDEDKKND